MKDAEAVRSRFCKLCTTCGLCAFKCPAFANRLTTASNQEIQKQVRNYLNGDPPDEAVVERSQLCNECYLCVSDTCPQGLDPMRVNQVLRGMLHEQGLKRRPFVPPSDPQSFERIAAALLTTEQEYKRITTRKVKGSGRILFFAGCNIYYQPNLLLTALDVLDLLVEDWAFLPGLDRCCGSNFDSAGRLGPGLDHLHELCLEFKQPGAKKVAVWCPTCAARLHLGETSIPVISFSRLLADHLADGYLAGSVTGGLTLHEPCKDGYLGFDTGQRELLGLVSGEPVREMARHGKDTVCCGWALREHRPEVWEAQFRQRLKEARAVRARTVATICHGCQWIMDRPDIGMDVRVVNYIRLVGEALGISHPERFKALRSTGSVDAAMEYIRGEMGDRYDRLPFDRDRVRQTVKILMGGFYGA